MCPYRETTRFALSIRDIDREACSDIYRFFPVSNNTITDKTRLTLSVIPRSTTEDGPMNVMVHCFFNWQAGGAFCIRSLYFLFIRKTIVFGPKM